MTQLDGKIAFITGGAQGIGLGIARACAAQGMGVAIVDIDEVALDRARAELVATTSVSAHRLDVRDRDAFVAVADQVEAELGPVHLLCNNAGVSSQAKVTNTSYAAYEWAMGINVDGPYNGIQTFLPRMLERGGGTHIVNTASGAGLMGNFGFLYAMAKYAVVGMSESLHLELAPLGIGVSVLCPSAVATSIIDHTLDSAPVDGKGDKVTEGLDGFFKVFRPMLSGGSDPDDVGRMVVDAVLADRFWILTDDTLAPYIRQRTDEIVAAMPATAGG